MKFTTAVLEKAAGILSRTVLVFTVLMLGACGGGTASPSAQQGGPLAGNWQIVLTQEFPFQTPPATLYVSGFFLQAKNSVTGSVQLPASTLGNCSGVGLLGGTLSGQNVTLSVDENGSTMSMTGSAASDYQSMSGIYETVAGGCSDKPTSGTWTAFKVPVMNFNFTGTLSQSTYMELLTGVSPPAPIAVSGVISQSANIGASSATLTGTITAVGYPCFRTASLTGTISGQNVILALFGYNGDQIGTIGTPLTPSTLTVNSGAVSLSGGLTLGAGGAEAFGPCPALPNGTNSQPNDNAIAALGFQ
ncbi:MAG: hypothetical protein WB421_04545 [Terriglobales bacterium]